MIEIVLSPEDEAHVQRLSEEGNQLVDIDDYKGALKKFTAALDILPTPKQQWEAALWLYASIGDMHLFLEDYQQAADNYYNALNCPDGQESGFVHLRLGEALYELEVKEKALDQLLRAYMLEGKEIFEEEEDKYFAFLQENVEGIV
jgi:tetratricopeptide (TPR) repeat protein